MKTNRTMMFALLGAAACSFFFGLGQHDVPAAVPNCQMDCCQMYYSWWNEAYPGGNQCSTAQNATTLANVNQAVTGVWVYVPSNAACKLNFLGNYTRWIWPDNAGTCQNPDKSWPSPQAVVPSGTSKNDPDNPYRWNECIP